MASTTTLGYRLKSFFWVIVAYAAGLWVFFYVLDALWLRGMHSLVAIGVADVACTLVVFLFSYFFRNTSFYDPYWSVLPIVIAGVLAVRGYTEGTYDGTRTLLVLGLVTFWGLRLTWNWARGWQGLHHIDWRYVDLERQTGRWFWLLSLFGLQLMPTVLVFLGCLALYPALTEAWHPMNWLDVVAAVWTLLAVLIELVADNQLRAFKRSNPEPGTTLTRGLWRYSRHPNYFGEVAFWWGLYLFGLAANPQWWWTVVGPLAMTALFHFVSIPMIEKRHLERRKDYEEVLRRVPRWIPWFPKSG